MPATPPLAPSPAPEPSGWVSNEVAWPASSPVRARQGGSVLRPLAIGLALILTLTVGIGIGRLSPVADPGTAGPVPAGSTATEFGLIREAWDTLHKEFVGASELSDRDLIYGAIKGMTQAVGDTGHTSFLTPEERAQRSNDLSGSYVGIGVRIDTAESGLPLIIGVFRGSPAEGAGLNEGDEIVAVDGKPTAGFTIGEVVDWVRGEAGSTVTVTVRKGATGNEREVSMVRADVAVSPVSWTLVPGTQTALLRLDQFSQGAADALIVALDDARGAGADRLVLDLRGNPGGYVNEADAVASQFLADGVVFIERKADGTETPHPVKAGGVATDLPLVVLVDAGTASSAEIVSGALQDAGRAQVIGITTFGTGTVLGEFALTDGSALRVGVVEWLTPDGRRIWHEGITPDVVVERPSDVVPLDPTDIAKLTPAEARSVEDPQLARALTVVTAIAATEE
ncbi:MAG: S41 family peptidase [Chloroflexi bacterium]|nr:S41 family peptidase [Chloroflexota bacterium]